MKIEAKPVSTGEVQLSITGSPGDKKQPIGFMYFTFDLTPAAAKRLAAQLTKLTGGAA